MTLMRRAGGFNRNQRLSRIYANIRPEYKIYVKRQDVQNLNELLVNAAEYERIEQERHGRNKNVATLPTAAVAYNPEECC